MRLDMKASTIAVAILWGAVVFLVGIGNLIFTGYGEAFLQMVASLYPGYHATASFGQVIVGTLYALVDGAIAGLVVSWLYNLLAARGSAGAV